VWQWAGRGGGRTIAPLRSRARARHATEADGAVSVFDVWDSMEQFQKFGETLVPIMKKLGVDPGRPQIMKVHNVKNG
jgi:hypothetical protein